MKKILSIAIILSFVFSASSQITGSAPLKYADGIEIDIKSFINSKTTNYGNNTDHTLYIAKGGRFKTAQMKISNNTNQDVEIDFQKIFLLDSKGNKYHVHAVAQGMKLVTTLERYVLPLKAGKSKTFTPEFWPPFPKGENVERMEINGEILELKKG